MTFHKIIQGDCLKVLPKIRSEKVDLVLTDPPYNVGLDYGVKRDDLPDDEYGEWCLLWVKELCRILKRGHYCIIFSGDKKLYWVFDAIMKSGLLYHHLLKWYKTGSQRVLPGTVLFGRTELAFVTSKGKPDISLINRRALYQDTLFHKSTTPSDKNAVLHDARRPISLYSHIIKGFTKRGDVVLDCFLGSGTTMIGCKILDRSCIGIEINPEYCKMAEERVERARLHKNLAEVFS